MGIEEITLIASSIGGALGLNKLYPIIKSWFKDKSEENKLKIKMSGASNSELVELLKVEIQELKENNKAQLEKIIVLEVSLATLRERYAEKTILKSGKFKDKT